MWDKSKKLPNLCSKIAPASPGVSDKKSPAPGGLGASIPRPRSGGGGPGASGGLTPGVGNSRKGNFIFQKVRNSGIWGNQSKEIKNHWLM